MWSALKARTNFSEADRREGRQIKDLTERARETNHLIAGLQKMLTPLLGRPEEPREPIPAELGPLFPKTRRSIGLGQHLPRWATRGREHLQHNPGGVRTTECFIKAAT